MLSGKLALVTGGATDIGREMARAYARMADRPDGGRRQVKVRLR